jgi:hypothetical protein
VPTLWPRLLHRLGATSTRAEGVDEAAMESLATYMGHSVAQQVRLLGMRLRRVG